MTTRLHHQKITVVSVGPDGHENYRDVYEATTYQTRFRGYGQTLEDAILDALRNENQGRLPQDQEARTQ